jgi:hypothetical protein
MKKLLYAAVIAATNHQLGAQPYGEVLYSHNSSILSSGTVCSNNPGFLMSGYIQNISAGGYNFYIDRTGPGGDFNAAAYEFQKAYQLYGDPANCGGSPTSQILTCNGVAVIETNLVPGISYAVAGSVPYGIFFALLSSTGATLATAMYTMAGSSSAAPKKVLIAESIQNPGEYYICAAIVSTGELCTIRVNSAGAQIGTFNRGWWGSGGEKLDPFAMIESPYFPYDLTIVGTALTITDGHEAFFLQMDQTTTAPNLVLFGQNADRQSFYSINVANSTTGGSNGFIVGGYEQSNTAGNPNAPIMMKLDPTGTIVWETRIEGTNDDDAHEIRGVCERLNNSSQYEYYGVGTSSVGTIVYKLNDGGQPFHITNVGVQDEFVYDPTGNGRSWGEAITYGTAGNENGLHIYGEENSSHYFVRAYFDGQSGCQSRTYISNYADPNWSPATLGAAASPSFIPCSNFRIVASNVSPYSRICGPFSGGSNNRTTDIDNEFAASRHLSPNPTEQFITLPTEVSGSFTGSVFNLAGGKVCEFDDKSVYVHSLGGRVVIDLGNRINSNGLYILELKTSSLSWRDKFIFHR